jgi:acetyl-CoA synthetase
MSDNELFPVPKAVAKAAYVDDAKYQAMYKESVEDPEAFWGEHGKRIHWMTPYTKVKDVSYKGDVHIRWYYDGTLNASANCLDRHLSSRGDQVAIIWEGDNPKDSKTLTYAELHREVCKFANVLKAQGARKGDRVTIYLPMIPEIAVAVLASARSIR